MSFYIQEYSTFSNTKVTSKEFTHTWEINNFKAVHPGVGESVSSTGTINDQKVWHLSVYADGWDADSQDFIGIYFAFEKKALKIEHTPYLVAVYIVDKNDEEKEVFKSEDKEECCFVFKLIEKSFLFSEKNGLLPGGDLILRFKICFPGEIVENPIQVSSCTNSAQSNFENMFNQEKFSDVKIVIGGDKVFWAYKGILANHSPVFSAMFEQDMKETQQNTIEIADINHEVFEEVLRFIYVGKVKNIESIAADLLAAADKYVLEQLRIKCEEALVNNLEIANVMAYLLLAEKYGAKLLKDSALHFFKVNAKEIIKTEDFKSNIIKLTPIFPEILENFAV